MSLRKLGLLGIVAALGLLLVSLAVACSDDNNDNESPTVNRPTTVLATATASNTPTGAEAQLCSDLASLDTATTALSSALSNSNSTVADIRAANAAVTTAYTSVQTSAQAVQAERTAAIDTAQADLQADMAALPDTATLATAVPSIQPSVDALAASVTDALTSLGC